ncbi:hypothetical protein [Aquimarina sp. 2201CG5-10]|uniref:hypothetical protein n=1 Tax=Aquimarina callyspongiae TaxID=3098150 RepID=UPI002AB58773|nr:hypothetical protein [Aquimarina sp. 2201CG5-10]MDY8137676.1 hypothetical protein [Aquimarina sp. 2201CG5-10]
MNNKLRCLILLLILINVSVFGQEYFEGELHYKIEYQTLHKQIPVSVLEREMGTSFTAYVQEDRYAMIYHAKGQRGWMKVIVDLKKGYSYQEFEKSDTIIKTKFGAEKEELITFKRNSNNKKKVLNELCESVTIEYKPMGTKAFFEKFKGRYYFNPKYKLNAELYKNYTSGFWNLYVKESESISIRNETEFLPLFKSVQEVTSIIKKEVSDKVFELNKTKIIKLE